MDNSPIIEFVGRDAVWDPLTELLLKGAFELLQTAARLSWRSSSPRPPYA